jgi:hypothetical protein
MVPRIKGEKQKKLSPQIFQQYRLNQLRFRRHLSKPATVKIPKTRKPFPHFMTGRNNIRLPRMPVSHSLGTPLSYTIYKNMLILNESVEKEQCTFYFDKSQKRYLQEQPVYLVDSFELLWELFMNVEGICKITKWEENDFCELSDKMKITKADVEFTISGEIEGNAVVQYVMFYSSYDKKDPHNSAAEYVGLLQFNGKLSGKTGRFVLEDRGSFISGMVSSVIKILENSGTSELSNIVGTGKYSANQSGFIIQLDYEI